MCAILPLQFNDSSLDYDECMKGYYEGRSMTEKEYRAWCFERTNTNSENLRLQQIAFAGVACFGLLIYLASEDD